MGRACSMSVAHVALSGKCAQLPSMQALLDVAADKAWTDAINLDPSHSSSWSNRGTLRLQFGILLNQLGNADGAVGEWEAACAHYKEAAEREPAIESIALANLALAYCELRRDNEACQLARTILRKDPEFLDVRAALTAFLWARGDPASAEDQWNKLQNSQDGLGGALYSRINAVDRVKSRWPPRPTAALDAFLSASSQGFAKGYDGKVNFYTFQA